MLDKLLHKYLKVPYTLNLAYRKRVRKARATVIFLHGIGRNGNAWQDVIDNLGKDIQVISVDLLGFGESPKPAWAKYSAKMQARSVGATLLKSMPKRPLVVVGHSLGALVATELARRHPSYIDKIILCSPPFYRDRVHSSSNRIRDNRLRNLYRTIKDHPERFVEIAELAVKYRLVKGPVNVSGDSVVPFMNALESSIINQTSLDDAMNLNTPMQIIHGALDPLVIKKNLKYLTRYNKNANLRVILAGHEIKSSTYINAVTEEITASVAELSK